MTYTAVTTTSPMSGDLYAALEAAANGNKQRMGTLHRLKQACDVLVGAGKDFSLRDIEAYCKVTFSKGPNAQSLSNDKGLRAYVDSRRSEADLQRRGKPKSPLDQDIESIPDPDLRSRMRMLVEEYRLTQKRFRILREGLTKLNPPLDMDGLVKGRELAMPTILPTGANVEGRQIDALRRVVTTLRDVAKLNRAGLQVECGDVVGRGLRETLAEDRDIALLGSLLVALGG